MFYGASGTPDGISAVLASLLCIHYSHSATCNQHLKRQEAAVKNSACPSPLTLFREAFTQMTYHKLLQMSLNSCRLLLRSKEAKIQPRSESLLRQTQRKLLQKESKKIMQPPLLCKMEKPEMLQPSRRQMEAQRRSRARQEERALLPCLAQKVS